jgi:hypothetical protein
MNKIIQEKYDNEIKLGIKSFISEVENELLKDESIKGLFKGWRVFFSPLIHMPKVLFIGINPGNGQSGVTDLDYFKDSSKLEYIEYENKSGSYIQSTYSLARETKEVFNEANLLEVLENSSVKINFFFLSTTSERDLYRLTDFLGRGGEKIGEQLFRKSAEWTRQLIKLIEPEVVICEGRQAFKNVTDLFKKSEPESWANNCGYVKVKSNKELVILGYSRRWSRIRNKDELIKLLKRFLAKNPN